MIFYILTFSVCDMDEDEKSLFKISQIDGETGEDIEELDNLKSILDSLLRDKLDKFEVTSLLLKFEVDIHGESSYLRQKNLLQKHVIERIIKEDENSYYSHLLDETQRLFNFKKASGYSCCLVGCLFKTDIHRSYIKHLQKFHFNHPKVICKFRNKCSRQFSSVTLLIEHVKTSHASDPVSVRNKSSLVSAIDVTCKCDVQRCGGRKFSNLKELMTHINVYHAKEPRKCIFYGCSHKFDANAESRHHFRAKHIALDKLKLNDKHLLVTESMEMADIEDPQEETGDENTTIETYDMEDLEFLETGVEEVPNNIEDEDDNFLMTYADFLNRMCHVKYVPHSTMHLIASEFSSQHLKSRELSGKKLKQSLQKLPGVSENLIIKIVDDSLKEDGFMRAQRELDTIYKLNKCIKEHFHYCSPIEIVLNKDDVAKGLPKEAYHYVPVTKAFKLLMEDDGFMEMTEKEREFKKNIPGVIVDVKDGLAYKNIKYFKENPGAMCAIFYSDALGKPSKIIS